MPFAENLRRSRLDRFLSQSELARLAGVHAVTVTRLESGKMAPSLRSVRALATALGVEPRVLAEPEEVAELRRTLGIQRGDTKDRDGVDSEADDGGAHKTDPEPSLA